MTRLPRTGDPERDRPPVTGGLAALSPGATAPVAYGPEAVANAMSSFPLHIRPVAGAAVLSQVAAGSLGRQGAGHHVVRFSTVVRPALAAERPAARAAAGAPYRVEESV